MSYHPSTPPLSAELAPYWPALRMLGRAAVSLVSRDLRRLAGLDASAAGDAVSFAQVHALARVLALPVGREVLAHALGKATRDVAVAARRPGA